VRRVESGWYLGTPGDWGSILDRSELRGGKGAAAYSRVRVGLELPRGVSQMRVPQKWAIAWGSPGGF
jgi:hypothetical protein